MSNPDAAFFMEIIFKKQIAIATAQFKISLKKGADIFDNMAPKQESTFHSRKKEVKGS